MTRYRLFETVRGTMAIAAADRGLQRVYLPSTVPQCRARLKRDFPAATEDETLLPALVAQLQEYCRGRQVDFEVKLDWSQANTFEVDAWRACRRVGWGRVATYKELAETLGRPGGARAIGMAMSRNPFPLVVPCHRVLRSDGGLGGYSGPGGVDFKRELLEMEGALRPA